MAIAFVSGATSVGSPTTTTTKTCNKPVGVANGHFLVAIVSRDQDASSVTGFTSSGWVQQTFFSVNSQYPSVGFLYKFAGSSEPTSYTFTNTGGGSTDQFGVHILAFSGVDISDPFLVDPIKTDATSASASVTAPGVTIPSGLAAQAMLVCAYLAVNGTGISWSAASSGMTENTDDGDTWLQMATYREARPAGASGSKTVTASTTPNLPARGVSFALRPLVLDQNITPVGIGSGVAIGTPAITVGAVTVSPSGIPSAYAAGNTIVAQLILPSGIPSAAAFGHALMDGSISGVGIPSALAFGHPAITVGDINVTPTGISHPTTFGTADVNVSLNPTGIAPIPHLFGTATILRGARTLAPVGIPPKGIFGTATVVREVVALTTQILVKPTPRVQYELVVVARVPQSNGAPSFIQIDPISWTSITYGQKLSAPDTLDISVLVSTLTDPIKQRLKKPNEMATELWLYRNGKVVFAGPLAGGQISNSNELSLSANGLLSYLTWMVITNDLIYKATDQFDIVKGVIDNWQNGSFRNLGIDTTSAGLSGVTMDITYLKNEVNNVYTKVTDLAKASTGFDIQVDPASRKLQMFYPRKGVDRSDGPEAIVFDTRNVTDTNITFALGPLDLATDAFGVGTGSGQDDSKVFYSTAQNDELRSKFGAVGITGTFRDVPSQVINDTFTQSLIDARNETLWIPGPNVRVTPDSDLNDYEVGDTVDYHLHNELDIQGAFRLLARQIKVDQDGNESVSVSFV